ncbi:hypothetical protein [Evansella tamaricis]|uniref:Uncharacterized protein n=1 Tax=Evansella tamaricis TaxID=2069301 RepID=A0ABS6JJA3_9BACI|nr:hypothetical protein [Evansella tamaricis]MBU9713666.1 hypothetical protein [Evansella tamaricis]
MVKSVDVDKKELKVYEGMRLRVWRKYFNKKHGHMPLEFVVVSTKHPNFLVLKVESNSLSYFETIHKNDFPKLTNEYQILQF